ncbi:hypothetical protein [Cellulomonas soli]
MNDAARDEAQAIKDLLAEHVPLALLVDLLGPSQDASSRILAEEGLPEDAWWDGDDKACHGTDGCPSPVSADDSTAGGVDEGAAPAK